MIERLGVTSIFVTHDQSEAIEVADEIIITNKGRIEQIGSPINIYQHPETAFSASFSVRLLRLTIIQSSRPLMLSIMLTVRLSVPNL